MVCVVARNDFFDFQLWNNLKILDTEKKVNCSNYTCNELLNNARDILEHFVRCKFKWICDACGKELTSELGAKLHNCEEMVGNVRKILG